MPTPIFLLYTIAGTVLWTAALTVAGYLLADAYEKIRDVVGPVGSILFGAVVLLLRALRAAPAEGGVTSYQLSASASRAEGVAGRASYRWGLVAAFIAVDSGRSGYALAAPVDGPPWV